MRRWAAVILACCVALAGCGPLRKVKSALRFAEPDPACEKANLCQRYGWCGIGAQIVQVGDETWAFEDGRLGSRSRTISFGFDSNPFGCPSKPRKK